ncbi:MAG: response regulator [Verrucomicrobia bacterium]|nr:response regulator [Verrucomicrobiota bacterium]
MKEEPVSELVQILLVEDNPGDVRLTRESFRECRVGNKLHVVDDGVKAMAFLRRAGEYAQVPRPNVIILDLNLPRKDGREVLEDIKADPDLKRIPVVILTSSEAEQDIVQAYNLHANCYISKPLAFEHFIKIVRAIEDFWFEIVKLPPK